MFELGNYLSNSGASLKSIVLDASVSRNRVGGRVYFVPNPTQGKKLGLFVPSR